MVTFVLAKGVRRMSGSCGRTRFMMPDWAGMGIVRLRRLGMLGAVRTVLIVVGRSCGGHHVGT